MKAGTYLEVRKNRDAHLNSVRFDSSKLNQFHDTLMMNVVDIAINQSEATFGPAPSPFTFFVMGSAGRLEQSVWSDQDHGIIFTEDSSKAKDYFLQLGKEITKGLFLAGYPYCEGGVMAENPLWCKSTVDWQQQVNRWISESTWESIRNLLIFIDARPLYGESQSIFDIKQQIFQTIHLKHKLERMWENTMHVKKGLNAFGQFLTESYGHYAGKLNLKGKVLQPYINAARLLAFSEKKNESSTLSRLEWLQDSQFREDFQALLELRLRYSPTNDYESGHYLAVNLLSKKEQVFLKEAIKRSSTLRKRVRKILEKEDSNGNE